MNCDAVSNVCLSATFHCGYGLQVSPFGIMPNVVLVDVDAFDVVIVQ